MPNWAFGDVVVTGTRKAVTSFAERFVSEHEPKTIPGKRHFGRSFLDDDRAYVMDVIRDRFEGKRHDEQASVPITVSFANSANACLIFRYPVVKPEDCISLSDACKEDHVSVHIHTFLFDEGSEEDITCTADGELHYDGYSMYRMKCSHCGEEQSVSRLEKLEEAECSECGEKGLVMMEDDEHGT